MHVSIVQTQPCNYATNTPLYLASHMPTTHLDILILFASHVMHILLVFFIFFVVVHALEENKVL